MQFKLLLLLIGLCALSWGPANAENEEGKLCLFVAIVPIPNDP